jgi:hypothetical protein
VRLQLRRVQSSILYWWLFRLHWKIDNALTNRDNLKTGIFR